MKFPAGPPTKWVLTLVGHCEIEIWADGYSEEDDCFVFSVLVDATEHEQIGLDVTGRTMSRPERVMVTVARIPVETVTSGSPRSA